MGSGQGGRGLNTRTMLAAGLMLAILAGGAALLLTRPGTRLPPPIVTAPAVRHDMALPPTSTGEPRQAPADCLLPGPPPVLPDGASADAAEMKAGHDRIQGFVKQLEAYQACRDAQHDHAGPEVSAKQKQDWLDQGDAAVDQAQALAKAFSAQLAVYRAAHPGR